MDPRIFKVLKLPDQRDFNNRLKPFLLDLAKNDVDFRIKQRGSIADDSWLDRHQYFPLETSWHSDDRLFEMDIMEPLCRFIYSVVNSDFRLTSMWAKIAQSGNAGSRHRHRGDVSGIYYVDVGYAEGEIKSGAINFYHEGDKYSIEPEDGNVIIFPASMFHDVDVYLGSSPRINISWNMHDVLR